MTKIVKKQDPKSRKNRGNIVKKRKRIAANNELITKLISESKSIK